MGFSKTYFSLEDVRIVLDRALAAEVGVKIRLPNHGQAINWRGRANYVRSRDRIENASVYEPGHQLHKQSIYDSLRIIVEDTVVKIVKVTAVVPEIEEIHTYPAREEKST